ncbi:type II toxin-antitoxin system prevent-host-death family antitoxin [Streptomyces roseifaciens]
MSATKVEHEQRIADVRNGLADAIGRARYGDAVTVLTNRGKRVAALVSVEFYERALAALGETRVLTDLPDESKS